MTSFIAKKSLGQHFLHAPNVVGAMIHAARIEPNMTVLEIGPGKGILTRGLLNAGANVIAVEKDERSIDYMKENFAAEIDSGKLKLVQDDTLKIKPQDLDLKKKKYVIVANIPYYITGEILRKFLTAEAYPSRMVLLVQKEVAKRIVATNGKESILSISVKAYGEPKYIDTVPKRFFRPMPSVDSAIILIDNMGKKTFTSNQGESLDTSLGKLRGEHSMRELGLEKHGVVCRKNEFSAEQGELRHSNLCKNNKIDEKRFFDIVRAGFAHKRKVLRGNLAKVIPAQTLEKLWTSKNWPINARAETFTLEQWIDIVKETRS
jgi:16S rRNA (adenine1518-N6/adenine1519-N6)-dimethyltransferase